jgi:hypothetical protein
MSYTSNPQPIGLTAPPGIAVLVVASEPGRALVDVVEPLVEAGAAAILVVDDGSSQARRWVLDRITMEPTVHLLRHAKPQGRGAALKTGMQYFAEHLRHYSGLVTTTADGQYSAADVLRVMRALHRSPKLVILGAREDGQQLLTSNGGVQRVTLRHRILRLLFRALTGVRLTDVQTRLRAIPIGLLPRLMKIPGAKYEYEMAMLLHIARSGYPMAEHSIFGNAEMRSPDAGFHPVTDSFDMLRALLNCTPVEQDKVEGSAERSEPASKENSHRFRAKQTR